VEKVINRRPITYLRELSDPGGGVPIPLCPEHFLLSPRENLKEEERELISDEFHLHQVLDSQGEVWKTLPNPLKEGEVVLVADDREKRLNWKMGVVRQLSLGRDGRCRAVTVQVRSGLLNRPIRKLYKLELCAESDNLPPITSSLESTEKDDGMLDSEAETMEDEDEEAEPEVTLPQRTRRGREIVRPSC